MLPKLYALVIFLVTLLSIAASDQGVQSSSSSDELKLRSEAADQSPDITLKGLRWFSFILGGLIVLVIINAISSAPEGSWWRSVANMGRPVGVDKLYVGVDYRVMDHVDLAGTDGRLRHAFLLSLSVRKGTLITSEPLAKGATVAIDLGRLSHPRKVVRSSVFRGRVRSCHFNRASGSYLVDVRLSHESPASESRFSEFLAGLHPEPGATGV